MLGTKAIDTSEFIIKTVAPIFNKNGYAATSMAHITKATNLTKGAIYGNFKNKETLAVHAFNYTIKNILGTIRAYQDHTDSPIQKLFALTDFYRNYYDFTYQFGGCPILNIGVDANNQNTELYARVKEVVIKIEQSVIDLLEHGKEIGEVHSDIDSKYYAKRLFVLVEGAVFMSFTMKDQSYLMETMEIVDQMIRNELQNSTE